MKYTICSREKDIMSVMWNVFTSFGYRDAVISKNNLQEAEDVKRLAVDHGMECSIMILNSTNDKAMAEIAAASVEAALAVGFPDFSMEISCPEKVGELLYLYSLDEYASVTEGDFSVVGKSGELELFKGRCEGNNLVCDFDMVAAAKAAENEHISVPIPETVIFTEEAADGIGYEIAYTMRMSGCLVTTYLGNGTINDCEKYAKDHEIESVIRVFADGRIQIKEMSKQEITETDYNTFVGYYDEFSDDDCGCGHDHHEHDCNCGHDHEHEEDCSCGHCH